MEDLNNTQIILLILFITFVTSIATGVVTVTLLDQSPPGVTQTINRVVERTIEKVTTPSEIKELRTVVSQGEAVSQAVKYINPSLVKIKLKSPSTAQLPQGALSDVGLGTSEIDGDSLTGSIINSISLSGTDTAIGMIISADRGLVLAFQKLSETDNYLVVLDDKREIPASWLGISSDGQFSVLKLNVEDPGKLKLSAISLYKDAPDLGKTVVAVGLDKDSLAIGVGIISKVDVNDKGVFSGVETDLNLKSYHIGGPIIDLSGKVVGITSSRSTILPSTYVSSEIDKALTGKSY